MDKLYSIGNANTSGGEKGEGGRGLPAKKKAKAESGVNANGENLSDSDGVCLVAPSSGFSNF
jgi:hypothetical protein